jgi:hypothetical protein
MEEINSRLDAVKHADRRKLIQESIIRADKAQKHSGNSAFVANQIHRAMRIKGAAVNINFNLCVHE